VSYTETGYVAQPPPWNPARHPNLVPINAVPGDGEVWDETPVETGASEARELLTHPGHKAWREWVQREAAEALDTGGRRGRSQPSAKEAGERRKSKETNLHLHDKRRINV
jgi:hypothetical protein